MDRKRLIEARKEVYMDKIKLLGLIRRLGEARHAHGKAIVQHEKGDIDKEAMKAKEREVIKIYEELHDFVENIEIILESNKK